MGDWNLLDIINTASCLVLLMYLLQPAAIARRWRHRVMLLPLPIVVALQALDPLVAWIPDLAWPSVALNVSLVLAITHYRRQLWEIAKHELCEQ